VSRRVAHHLIRYHANARLNAKAAGKQLFYIPAVDSPASRMGRADYDDMQAAH